MSVVSFGTAPSLMVRRRVTEEQFRHFAEGVSAVLQQWTALGLVSSHCDCLAGQTLYQDVIKWFSRDGEVYSDELELFFEDFFAEARSVIVEDDSMKEVADIIYDMYCRCGCGDYSTVELYRSLATSYQQNNILTQCCTVNMNAESSGDDDRNEEDEMDENGEGLGKGTGACSSGNGRGDGDGLLLASGGGAELNKQACGGVECEEEEAPHKQRHPQRNKKRKNAFQKSCDGWSTVCR